MLNSAIPDDQFRAPLPPGASSEDRTEPIIKGLDQAISIEAERKKRDAAREEEPLKGPPIEIEIPPMTEPQRPR